MNKRVHMRRLLKIFVLSVLLLAWVVSASAQGTVIFNNNSVTRISTNSVIGGPTNGFISGVGNYRFALFYSTNATSVNGQTAAVVGGTATGNIPSNYALNDSSWTFAAYGTNIATLGRFLSMTADGTGQTVVPGLPAGMGARFVVMGWSTTIGTNLSQVSGWMGTSATVGWIGQSPVSAVLYPGGGIDPAALLFGSGTNLLPGFTLGLADSFDVWQPYIVSQPTNVTVFQGGTASFSVSASANPSPTFQWRLNGTNIGGATSASLVIPNAQPGDAGSYSVVVSNYLGTVISSNALLTVTSPVSPTIDTQPVDITAAAGANVAFTVAAHGTTPLAYQWTFNGTNLPAATNASLPLNDIQPVNAGSYAVTITNLYGSTNSATVTLTVQTSPPNITAQPQNNTVQAGSQATFTVIVTGTAPLNYQWTFNGTNLPGATSPNLTINSAQSSDAGTYAVSISNTYGSTNSANATLTVTTATGYIIFQNTPNSATKIFTNSTIGGPVTGLTMTNLGSYRYALFVSGSATTVNGSTNSILGNATADYVFSDTNWTFVTYGTNTAIRGRFLSASRNASGLTAIPGFAPGSAPRFVVIGWSANIGDSLGEVISWFNGGSPLTDGWIGESRVSGGIALSDGGIIPPLQLFGSSYPTLQGFPLGLVSADPNASYPPPNIPPPVLSVKPNGTTIKLSWPQSYDSYQVQSKNLGGSWTDISGTPVSDGTNWSVTVPMTNTPPFFRLIVK